MEQNLKNKIKIMKVNRTMDALKGILDSPGVRTKKGEPFTHVTKASPYLSAGSYFISKENEVDFLVTVCNAVRADAKLTLAEKVEKSKNGEEYAPLRVDFDFQADIQFGTNRFYTENDVKCLVKYYQDELRIIIDSAEFKNEMLTCIVLEKENARVEDGKLKDGFHFHFPHFICNGKIQDEYLRTKVTQKILANEDLFTDEGIFTEREKLIDTNMSKKPWMMYGSMNFKTNESTPYMYNRRQPPESLKGKADPWAKTTINSQWGHVYDHNLNEIPMYNVFADEMTGRKNSVRYYLPMFLSIRGYTEPTPIKSEIERKLFATANKTGSKKGKVINKNRSDKDIYEDLKKITDGHIMEMLSEDRASNYDDWIDVGFILFNISNGKEEGLNMWIEFSQRSPNNYKPGECEELWETMEVRNKTIGGLFALAKKDSPELYQKWRKTNKYSFLEKSLQPPKPNEYDVSMVAYASAGDRFVCANAKQDIWYEFRDHRWHKTNDALSLKIMLIDDVLQDYCDYNFDLAVEMKDPSTSDMRKAEITGLIKKVMAIIDRLKSVSFQKHVIEMCKLRMTNESFLKKANANTFIMCCENGVLDLELGIFRDGRPDDYCTISTGLYYQEYDPDDKIVAEFDECLLKTFPNKNLRDYFMDMVTSCMEGGNVNKRIFICTGQSNAGKSAMMKIIEKCFGEYFGKFPRELFLRGRGSTANSARPELMHAENRRVMSTQEITHMDNFDIGVLKESSGNDSVATRGMWQKDMRDIHFQFTTILQCNEPPGIPGSDEATWSRVRIVDFESRFVIECDLHKYPVPETFEEQLEMRRFHADTNFKSKIEDFANVLQWKAFHHYKVYKKFGLREPKEVMLSTHRYQTKNDVYQQFFEEKMKKVDKEDAKKTYIGVSSLYTEFKDWYRENHPSYAKQMPGMTTVRNEMIKKTGNIDKDELLYGFGEKNRFWGYKLIYDDKDDDRDDEKRILQ